MATDPGAVVSLKYFFTLTPTVSSSPVGDVPGGYRVDLNYTGAAGAVSTNEALYGGDWVLKKNGNGRALTYKEIRAARKAAANDASQAALLDARKKPAAARVDWFGIDGEIASGTDWVTVRYDGVATFDGRITIKADDASLIDAVISGAVDLRNPADPMPSPSEERSPIFNNWLMGKLKDDPIPVVLPMRFEAANASAEWANNAIKQASVGYWKFQRLVRGQFVAIGQVKLQKARCSPIGSVYLEVYEICSKVERR